jgi:hypothetical protein
MMRWQTVIVGTALLAVTSGCNLGSQALNLDLRQVLERELSGRYFLGRAALDSGEEVALSLDWPPPEEGGLENMTTAVVVRCGDTELESHPISRPADGDCDPNGVFNSEWHADETGCRLWLVDPTTSCILATLDRATGDVAACPAYPPHWADPGGGTKLRALQPPGLLKRRSGEWIVLAEEKEHGNDN